jgi:uncharacterized membrane protein YqaE (UPF0057 family)
MVSDSSITVVSLSGRAAPRISSLRVPFGENTGMGLGRALLCIFLPPLAVLDKGCGTLLLVSLLTLAGWVPGVIGALVVCGRTERR